MAQKITPQRNLFDSERRFRLLVEGVVDYAIYMLDPSGIVTNWNAGARRIKGYEAAEVVGRHFGMFYLPEDREAGMPARSLETARENGRFEAEGWRLRKDGTKFLASVVIDAIYEDGRTDRLCQDHARHYRASECRGGAERQRKAIPAAGLRRYRLRALYARPERDRHQLEYRRAAHQGVPSGGNHRSAFFPLLLRRPTRRPAGRRAPCDWRGITAATKRMAGASARTAPSSGPAS